MAKKNRKKDEALPEGMSRRQAKLAARAAERAALEKDPRPYAGLACEPDLVALQEFVPSATAVLPLIDASREIHVATVLPGASAAFVRDAQYGGDTYVGLQCAQHSQNPGRDLAYALTWVATAEPGTTLDSTVNDGTQPALSTLIDPAGTLDIEVHDNFDWWTPKGATLPLDAQQAVARANESIVPARHVTADIPGSAWWTYPGGNKAYIRWVRADDNESALLAALARIAARGDLHLGPDTKFAGVFRTHGLIVPVFDLLEPTAKEFDGYNDELVRVNGFISEELANDAQLSADERKQLENIKSRQVTIR